MHRSVTQEAVRRAVLINPPTRAPEWLPAEVGPQLDLWSSRESLALVQAITDQPLIAVPAGNGLAEPVEARSRRTVPLAALLALLLVHGGGGLLRRRTAVSPGF